MLIRDLIELFSSVNLSSENGKPKFKVNLHQNRIRSISAYSSNSIFYFPLIVSDQLTPEEVAMCSKMIEKSCASFVVACISLMPFHRIKADDQASVESYLSQFHQNLGMNPGSGPFLNKAIEYIDSVQESSEVYTFGRYDVASDYEASQELNEATLKSAARNKLPNKAFGLPSERKFPLHDPKHVMQAIRMFHYCEETKREELADNIFSAVKKFKLKVTIGKDNPLYEYAPKTFQENTTTVDEIKETQDFLYECWRRSLKEDESLIDIIAETVSLNDMYNIDPVDAKTKVLQEQYKAKMEELDTWGFVGDADPDEFDEKLNREDDEDYDADDNFDDDEEYEDEDEDLEDEHPEFDRILSESSVKSAVDQIKFSLESVSENKIMSCNSLTKLSALENKLKVLKGKYAKYLNRYKRKYEENKKSGSKSKLAIRFNKMMITDPKAFMKQYGSYIGTINRRLALVEKRRAELRKRKGIPDKSTNENTVTDLTSMDFAAIDYCIKSIDECIDAPDRDVFVLTEAPGDTISTSSVFSSRFHDNTVSYNRELSHISSSNSSKEDDIYYDAKKPKSNINARKVASAGQKNFSIFDKDGPFTKMDMQKANEAVPTFAKASIGFIVDETEEVVTRDILIGIKAYVHRAPSLELINDIYNGIINKRKFLRFVKFITGEEKSLGDLLFGIKNLKNEALETSNTKSGEWRGAFKRRRRWSKMSVPFLMKEYTPNGTIVITMNEVNFIKDEYGIDIMRKDHVKMIMDNDFLLSFVIVDQANEMVYVTYDGHDYGFQQYTYAMLERESSSSDRLMRELYRSFSR